MAFLNCSRFSAFLMASYLAPINSTLYLEKTPRSEASIAVLSPVWPPMVGRQASGLSRSMIFSSTSTVTGSMYVRSAMSGSVMMVAGLEFTRTTSKPSSLKALQAWVPE